MKKVLIFFLCLFYLLPLVPNQYMDLSLGQKKKIRVEVRGEVVESGFYDCEQFSTIEQLLERCKVTQNADLSAINKAMILKDSDLLIIPSKNEIRKISINHAILEQLMEIKGIGIKTATEIIHYREQHGLFQTLEDLMQVKGIGVKTFDKIKDLISL